MSEDSSNPDRLNQAFSSYVEGPVTAGELLPGDVLITATQKPAMVCDVIPPVAEGSAFIGVRCFDQWAVMFYRLDDPVYLVPARRERAA